MPWQTKDTLSMRDEFVNKAISGNFNISDLCSEYKISRKTGYKWIERYRTQGVDGLLDQSQRPHSSNNRILPEITNIILNVRSQFPAWGAKKLRQYLINKGHNSLPCEMTFNRILKRNGRIELLESEKRQHFIRFEKERPNELWQMDFKGHFKMDSKRCHPLTVLDDHSRFSIALKACNGETFLEVKAGLERAFCEYGLPEQMAMDNGSPWKGSPPWSLSQLTVWLMRLGIKVCHSSVRHPQTLGKDERFHRSLKEEVLKYHQFRNLVETQKIFNDWRQVYNFERPHEGIGLLCPYQRYKPSVRPYPNKLPEIAYRPEDIIRKVQACGCVNYRDIRYFVGEHLKGEYVALRATSEESIYGIYFVNTKVGNMTVKGK
jgi:transposase InsO family protein